MEGEKEAKRGEGREGGKQGKGEGDRKRKRGRREERAGAVNHFQIPPNIMGISGELRLCNTNDVMPITLSDFTKSCRKSEHELLIQKNMNRLGAGFQDSPGFIFLPSAKGVRTSPSPLSWDLLIHSAQKQAPNPGLVSQHPI